MRCAHVGLLEQHPADLATLLVGRADAGYRLRAWSSLVGAIRTAWTLVGLPRAGAGRRRRLLALTQFVLGAPVLCLTALLRTIAFCALLLLRGPALDSLLPRSALSC